MNFKTQWTAQMLEKKVFEETGEETLVVKGKIRGNSEKLAQMQLAGVYVEGNRLGYEFQPGDKLPEKIDVKPGKYNTDIIETLKFAEELNARIKHAVNETARKKAETERTGNESTVGTEKIPEKSAEKAG